MSLLLTVGESGTCVKLLLIRNVELVAFKSKFILVLLLLRFEVTTWLSRTVLDLMENTMADDCVILLTWSSRLRRDESMLQVVHVPD
jgi:hypothetical protein